MSRAEKATEPSMEDILSSIRKIIAEDPTAAKAPPLSAPPAAARAAAKPAVAKPSTASSLDDILGMADESSSAAQAPTAKTEVSAPEVVSPPVHDRRPPQAERAPIQPFFPPQTRDQLPSARSIASPSIEAAKSEFGAIVPSRPDGGLMERINGSASGGLRPSAPAPELSPAKTVEVSKPVETPAAVVVAKPGADVALANAAAQKAAEPAPVTVKPQAVEARVEVKPEPARVEVAKIEAAKPEPTKIEPAAVEPTKAEAPKPTTFEIATAVAPTPVAAASPIVTPPQRRVVTVDTVVPGTAVTVTPKPAAPAPAVTATASVPAAAEPVRSMEDTVAELLRPMLRQWLDQNMPRVVEKALRVELAASAQAKNDPSKT